MMKFAYAAVLLVLTLSPGAVSPARADAACDPLLGKVPPGAPPAIVADLNVKRAAFLKEKIFPNVPAEQIEFKGGEGRVEVMPEVDFAYFVQTTAADTDSGEMLLIPMATSRLAPGYISSPDWWNAHLTEINAAKASGSPLPFEDKTEVANWLRTNNLSTNPLVYRVAGGVVEKIPLQKFLLDEIFSRYDGPDVVLYRGADRATELGQWKSGVRPKGARYWTPDATYAWRYARKDPDFLPKLIQGDTPLIQFKMSKLQFKSLVEHGDLVLGTELTKNAHQAFDSIGVFQDHLVGSDFMGDRQIGVEIEIRGNGRGSAAFIPSFQGAAGIDEVAQDRIRSVEQGTARLKKQEPWRAAQLDAQAQQRITRTNAEAAVLKAIQSKAPAAQVNTLFAAIPPGRAEIANVDGVQLAQLVHDYRSGLPFHGWVLSTIADFDSVGLKLFQELAAGRSDREFECLHIIQSDRPPSIGARCIRMIQGH